MPDISRRRLLTSAGALSGAALAAEFLPQNVQRALAATPSRTGRPNRLSDIKHVVILMQENRSFDHYFGTLPGVRGFADPAALTLGTGKSVFHQPDPQNPDGYTLPFHLNTSTSSAQAIPSTSHAWSVQHSAWNGGKMDNWLPAHRAADGKNGPYTMGYYTEDDIPFHFALAKNFTILDSYHCSLMGPTWPNRLYLMSAWIDPEGVGGGPITSNQHNELYKWKTYPEALTEAGVSWRVYQEVDNYGTNVLEYFDKYVNAPVSSPLYQNALRTYSSDRFEHDAAHDNLPTVSWILPTSWQSEHPDYTPAAGADFVAGKIDAIASNPDVWAKTVFILNYDENDGLFDHVPPPTPPAGTAGEFVDGVPIGGGFRVPCIIVSPWTAGGWISSATSDHTSTLQFLERLTGVRIPNITDWRRDTFSDLTSALGFPARSAPQLPDTKRPLARAVQEIATLPAPALPGADQSMPGQQHGSRPRPRPGA
ncbi:alkaline phosphatase family protein [Catenulispora pinisilvae]|uniref:alkaline phosphatase family protein n=1 Tax=Catenulispora pinisilvae TaxID=2705253 RepID=UPI00189159F5|nr:alkaline phosphatase family protein [Catenulispora pinisilvae]